MNITVYLGSNEGNDPRLKTAVRELDVDEMLAIKNEIDAWKERRPVKKRMPVIMNCCTMGLG